MARSRSKGRSLQFFTDYAEQTEDELVIPEDLTTLSDEDLDALVVQATEAFNALYQNGEASLTEEDFTALESITSGIEALQAETTTRETAAQERRDAAAALAARVQPQAEGDTGEDSEEDEESEEGDADESEADADAEDGDETEDGEEPEALAAGGGRRATRVNLRNLRNRQRAPRGGTDASRITQPVITDVAFASTEAGGFGVGAPLDFNQMAEVVDHRLGSYSAKQYENAALLGKKVRNQFGIASIRKPQGDLKIERGASSAEIEDVLKRATDQSALPGGSLVASGGWCAPSEIIYDIYDCGEVADGLLNIPTIGMPRGGLRFNKGVGFQDLLTQTGFFYTEQQDIDGTYGVDENGVGDGSEGPKPCFHIPCIDFEEVRMDLDGLCLTAGLLQARGYPEVIADTIRKALIAHEIRMDSRRIADIVAGSTAVSLPGDQVGATAPILTAIELQAQHYRSSGSLSDTTVLEGVFPQWVRGAIRSDLSRRLGVDLISVPNSRINQWFTDRLIAPQFVANWQNVGTTAASGFTAWPTEVDFLLYKAGTWVGGQGDVITLDNVYDSTLTANNDYTALFTEEGIATFMRGCDSRVVTVPICPTGDTGGGVAIDCDGSAGA